jgi:hypothetical protein
MNAKNVRRERVRLVSRLADAAVTIPVTAGYVALGATVLAARSLRDAALRTRGLTRHRAAVSAKHGRHTPKAA